MKSFIKRLPIVLVLPAILGACAKESELTNDELIRHAYLDVIEATQEKIRPLVNLTKDDKNITWNETGDKVLLFTFHRYPDSYPEGQEITFTWNESWL